MTGDHQDYEPLFDKDTERRVTALLDSGLPQELAAKLLATGSVATTRPGGRLTASLSRWEGVLRWTAQGASGGSDGMVVVGRWWRDPPENLRAEVELRLAAELAGLDQ